MKTRSEASIVGYLAKDPEFITKGAANFANMVVGTNETFLKKTGEKESHATWHEVSIYSDYVINHVMPNLKKGDPVFVQGTIKQYDKFVDTKEGERKIPKHKIVVSAYFGDVYKLSKPPKKEEMLEEQSFEDLF